MTLDQLRPFANRVLDPIVDVLETTGVTPDAVSGVAFLLAAGAGVAFGLAGDQPRLYLVGAALTFANGWLDLVDGALARRLETASPGGDLLDHVLDRYADVVIIAGLTAGISQGGQGEYALGFAAVTGVLLTSYLGTQVEAVGLDREYGGVMGRADRLAIVTAVGVVAAFVRTSLLGLTVVGWLLVLLAVVGHFTALQRFLAAWRDVDADEP
jgi:archaetidylinositol phosphate synthase